MIPDSDLLRPSLSRGRDAPVAIYSVRTVFVTSFFGGPIAATLITLINAQRLHRLSREWPLALGALGLVIWLRWLAARHALAGLETYIGQGVETGLWPIASLIFFGIGYALHAPYHRSHIFLDLPTPNGVPVGALCIVIGLAVEGGVVWMIP